MLYLELYCVRRTLFRIGKFYLLESLVRADPFRIENPMREALLCAAGTSLAEKNVISKVLSNVCNRENSQILGTAGRNSVKRGL